MNIFSYMLPRYSIDKNKPIRLISLFSGYDSQKLGFNYLNIPVEHYRAIEFDKYAIQSLNEIHGTNFTTNDITKINADDLGIVDTDKFTYLLTYSFPCTDLSNAGKKAGMEKGSGTRSGLLWEVERLLKESKEKCQVLIMENVPQVLSSKGWREWLLFLEGLGYSNYVEVLNAKDYGIPQNRERCFMVSILGDYSYEFPKKIPLTIRLKDILEDEVDEKYYLSKQMIEGMTNTNFESYKLENKIQNPNGIANCIIARFEGTPQCIYVEKKYQEFISENGYIPEMFNPYNNAEIKDIAPTQTTQCGSITSSAATLMLKKDGYRKFTPKECFKLMAVKPSDYAKITCSNAQKYKQAGNSIVTTVLMAIYSQLFEDADYKYYIDKLIEDLKE